MSTPASQPMSTRTPRALKARYPRTALVASADAPQPWPVSMAARLEAKLHSGRGERGRGR